MDKRTFFPPASNPPHGAVTASQTFGLLDDDGHPLLQVRAGVKAETALAQVALLLKGAYETAYVGSIVQAVESAQALVDAVLKGAMHRPG